MICIQASITFGPSPDSDAVMVLASAAAWSYSPRIWCSSNWKVQSQSGKSSTNFV